MNNKTTHKSPEYVLELKDVEKIYAHPSGQNIPALNNITLNIPGGSFIMICGPSGSGKTTFLKIASLIEKPSKGSVVLNGHHTEEISAKKRSKLIQNEIGFILPRFNLLNYLNAMENITLPMKSSNKKQAKDLMDYMGFHDYKKYPDNISPLDQQKVALCRALINHPSLILADEPTGDLNRKESIKFLKLLQSFKKESTIIMATDNPDLIKYSDNVLRLQEGKLSLNSL